MGAWSFSFYLLHEPFLRIAEMLVKSGISDWVAALLGEGASLLAAFVVHIYVEKPRQTIIKRISGASFLLVVREFSLHGQKF
jgi:peptidoglycan/LPS O-acetylase OafA/YrhL